MRLQDPAGRAASGLTSCWHPYTDDGVEHLLEALRNRRSVVLSTGRGVDQRGGPWAAEAMHETSRSPLVSIVVPAYNHEAFVTKALDSTLNSGLEPVELLVCDDHSSDRTPDIVQAWARLHADRFSRFALIRHRVNAGTSCVLNELIGESRGEVIHGLASDDFYVPGGLLTKTQRMLANPDWAGAFCDGLAVGLDGHTYVSSLMAASVMDPERFGPGEIAEELLRHWGAPANLLSWRRWAFKAHGGEFEYDSRVFCEDLDFAWWAMSRDALGYVPAVCFAYRCRSWPQANARDAVRELRDVAHVLAKYAPAFPPYLADSMRTLALSHFYRAAGDVKLADDHMQCFLAGTGSPGRSPETGAPRTDCAT